MSHSLPCDDAEPSGARAALIRGAMNVIAKKGLRGMTFRAVAADAGLSHGMIVHYFGSRDALIEAAMRYATRRNIAGATVTVGDADLGEIGAHLRDVADDPQNTVEFQQEMLAEARRRPDLAPLARQMVEDFESVVSRQLNAHGFSDPDLIILVAAAMDGLVQRQITVGDGDTTDRAMARLRELLLAAKSL